MKKYRVTFTQGPNSDRHLKYDVEAESTDDAFSKAYKDLKTKGLDYVFTDSTTEEWPEGASTIGIRFKYYEASSKRDYSQYMFIYADTEDQAVAFYNKTFKGKRFFQPWPKKVEENGNCIYKNVVETYFAGCPCADFDATGTHGNVVIKRGE